jgi:hypothetical protein
MITRPVTAPSPLLAQTSTQSQHQIFVLEPEHHAAPAAAHIFVLIGNMLPSGHEIRQNSAERQIVRQAGGSGRLEDARGKQRAALGDLRRLEFVAQTLFERRHLAGSRVSVQVLQVAMERARHLVDRRGGLGADELNERIFRRSSARTRHAGRRSP